MGLRDLLAPPPAAPGRGLRSLLANDETEFRSWYGERARRLGISENPDDPLHKYDYRAAFRAGAEPDQAGHWPSQFKHDDHPQRFVGGLDTKASQEEPWWKRALSTARREWGEVPRETAAIGREFGSAMTGLAGLPLSGAEMLLENPELGGLAGIVAARSPLRERALRPVQYGLAAIEGVQQHISPPDRRPVLEQLREDPFATVGRGLAGTLPQLGAIAGATMATGGAALPAALGASMSGLPAYSEARGEGVGRGAALGGALAEGAVGAVLEPLGAKAGLGLLGRPTRGLRRLLAGAAGESTTEYSQEELSIARQRAQGIDPGDVTGRRILAPTLGVFAGGGLGAASLASGRFMSAQAPPVATQPRLEPQPMPPTPAKRPTEAPLPPAPDDMAAYLDELVAQREGAPTPRPVGPPVAVPVGASALRPLIEVRRSQIDLRPEVYQFKDTINERGETGRLHSVKSWDQIEPVIVWPNPETGRLDVTDGHQRVGLFDRLGEDKPIRAIVDNVSKNQAEARAFGALANLRTGSANPFEIAKLFRDGGFTMEELASRGVSLRESGIRKGETLAKLDPAIFTFASRGRIPENQALILGEELPGQFEHQRAIAQSILEGIDQDEPLKDADVLTRTRLLRDAGIYFGGDAQMALGGVPEGRSLSKELDEVYAGLRKLFVGARREASPLAKTAVASTAAAQEIGQIDTKKGEAYATKTRQEAELFDRRAYTQPYVGFALDAARRLASGEPKAAVLGELGNRFREQFASDWKTGGVAALPSPTAPTTPQGAPAGPLGSTSPLLPADPFAAPEEVDPEEAAAEERRLYQQQLEEQGQGGLFGVGEPPPPPYGGPPPVEPPLEPGVRLPDMAPVSPLRGPRRIGPVPDAAGASDLPFQTSLAARLELPESEAEQLHRMMAEDLPAIQEQRRGTRTWAETQKAATGIEKTARWFENLVAGKALNAEEAFALESRYKGVRMQLDALRPKILAKTATPHELARFEELAAKAQVYLRAALGVGTEAARALNILKATRESYVEGPEDMRRQLARKYGKGGLSPEQENALVTTDLSDPDQVLRLTRILNPSTNLDLMTTYFQDSIMSGTQTMGRNVVTDVWNTTTANIPGRIARGAISAVRDKPGERTYYATEAIPAMVGLMRGLPAGAKKAVDVLRYGYGDAPLAEVGALDMDPWSRSPHKLARQLAPVVTFSLRAAAAINTISYETNKSASLYAQAWRNRLNAGRGVPTRLEDLDQMALELSADPVAVLKAANESRSITLTDPMTVVGRKFNEIRQAVPMLKLIQPFVFFGDRALSKSVDYTPGAPFVFRPKKTMALTGEQAMDLAAHQLIGAAVLTVSAVFAALGRVTGPAPRDPIEKERFYDADKKQPWAILLGGHWFPLTQIGPVGMPFAVVASIMDAHQRGESVDEKIGMAASNLGKFVLNQSWMSGMAELVRGIDAPDGGGWGRYLRRTAGAFMPKSGLTRGIATTMDTRVVQPETLGEQLKSQTPFLREDVPARLNVWGEEQHLVTGRLGGMGPGGSPLVPSRAETDPVTEELRRLGVRLGHVGKTIDGKPLTREQHRLYQQTAGRKMRADFEHVMASENYRNASPAAQIKQLEKYADLAREHGRAQIRKQLAAESGAAR